MANVKYETVLVLNTKEGEEGIKALIEKFSNLIAQNGTVDNVDEWGKRRLAYEIDDETEGYYVQIDFTSEPEFPAELDRVYKITSGILRTLIIKKEQ
ncbi:30S ribosomal protein S6 [Neobittarella massiliensis]|uniref:Small ribosomal subunit protein bS6 n=2 Tax=Oscillospiraceae TaxID=216572 RepID=A0A8J6IIP8_9FIRM|nr:30S ribosomal protein S6 [Neobittarella massiliensis]MBC3515171.1 30S ribosomal protein S6 [Neobittarella massiliensis]SCJ63179.1 30S ribosomal protein S6 [uncultured Anaerotruncus sp.]